MDASGQLAQVSATLAQGQRAMIIRSGRRGPDVGVGRHLSEKAMRYALVAYCSGRLSERDRDRAVPSPRVLTGSPVESTTVKNTPSA
jgi:hypothetical protein